jgi:o-succinylbenzoate synthase
VRIERVELREIRIPLLHPFETSFGRTTEKIFLLVSVSADGVTGYGECVTDPDPFYLPETNGTVAHVVRDFLVPMILGRSFDHPADLWPSLERVRGHNMAKACLEMAVWELAARRASVPLYSLFGGRGGTIASGVSIGLQADAASLVKRVGIEVASGYRRIKIKIKRGADVELARAVRADFPKIALMVDANSDYTLGHAEHLRELDVFDLMMIEQPLQWNDIGDHAILQRELKTPICLDESIGGPEDARLALQLHACRIINIKVGRVGGFLMAKRVEEACRQAGVPVWCGGMLESGIGRLANVHIQTLPGFTLPGDTSASGRYFAEDIVDPPVTVDREGRIAVPEAPGIGHDVVWSRVEKATTWREEWRS